MARAAAVGRGTGAAGCRDRGAACGAFGRDKPSGACGGRPRAGLYEPACSATCGMSDLGCSVRTGLPGRQRPDGVTAALPTSAQSRRPHSNTRPPCC